MRRILIAAAAVLVAAPAMATDAVQFMGGGNIRGQFSGMSSITHTIGWQFSTSGIRVSALGWWVRPGFTLLSSHQVGIWSSTGTLLGSTIITAGGPTDSQWRFAAVTPFNLAAGTYFIGGTDGVEGDDYVFNIPQIIVASGVHFLGAAVNVGDGFSVPSIVTANSGGRFGPNFQFGALVNSVPEPASWAMLIAGFGLVGAALRRRRIAVAAQAVNA